jgi:hypothetical protein
MSLALTTVQTLQSSRTAVFKSNGFQEAFLPSPFATLAKKTYQLCVPFNLLSSSPSSLPGLYNSFTFHTRYMMANSTFFISSTHAVSSCMCVRGNVEVVELTHHCCHQQRTDTNHVHYEAFSKQVCPYCGFSLKGVNLGQCLVC